MAIQSINPATEDVMASFDEFSPEQVDALGPLLAKSYMAVKRKEYETFSANDDAFELKHHFWKF